jgi:hypothetical protein
MLLQAAMAALVVQAVAVVAVVRVLLQGAVALVAMV